MIDCMLLYRENPAETPEAHTHKEVQPPELNDSIDLGNPLVRKGSVISTDR